jgi:hypothetical protein
VYTIRDWQVVVWTDVRVILFDFEFSQAVATRASETLMFHGVPLYDIDPDDKSPLMDFFRFLTGIYVTIVHRPSVPTQLIALLQLFLSGIWGVLPDSPCHPTLAELGREYTLAKADDIAAYQKRQAKYQSQLSQGSKPIQAPVQEWIRSFTRLYNGQLVRSTHQQMTNQNVDDRHLALGIVTHLIPDHVLQTHTLESKSGFDHPMGRVTISLPVDSQS